MFLKALPHAGATPQVSHICLENSHDSSPALARAGVLHPVKNAPPNLV